MSTCFYVHLSVLILRTRPFIGGALARPADHFPDFFSGPFWEDYPYFLPCGVTALVVAVITIILFFFLKEVRGGMFRHLPATAHPTRRHWLRSATTGTPRDGTGLSNQIPNDPYHTPSYRYPSGTSSYHPSFTLWHATQS